MVAVVTQQRATTGTKTTNIKTLVEKVISLDNQVDSAYVDLAAYLYQAKKFDAHTAAGFAADHAGFVAFCDTKLKIGYRRAQYLIGIHEKALELHLKKDDLEVIGWSKMKEIVPLLDSANVGKLIEAAKTMTLRELQEHIQQMRKTRAAKGASVDGSTVNSVAYKFAIDERDNDTVRMAIEEAKKRRETGDAAEAFVTICEDWLALGGHELPNTLDDYFALIERHFGVKVAMVEGGDIPPTTTEVTKAPAKVETPPPFDPGTPEDTKVRDDLNHLFEMKIGELQAFAATNGIVIPATVKGKMPVRDFIVQEMMKKTSGQEEAEAPPTENILEPSEGDEGEGEDIDLTVATSEQLMKVATKFGIKVAAKLQKPKAVEEFRTFIMDTLKAMGFGDEADNVPELTAGEGDDTEGLNAAIVAAEEEREALELCEDDRKKMVAFIKDKGYADEYKNTFGQPAKDITADDFRNNIVSLISAKYGVSFDPAEEEAPGNDLDFDL